MLRQIVPDLSEPPLLFVTDDEPPPWPCVVAPIPVLVDMLREQRFFEYFIVDPRFQWVIFDTHHNALVGFGQGLTFP